MAQTGFIFSIWNPFHSSWTCSYSAPQVCSCCGCYFQLKLFNFFFSGLLVATYEEVVRLDVSVHDLGSVKALFLHPSELCRCPIIPQFASCSARPPSLQPNGLRCLSLRKSSGDHLSRPHWSGQVAGQIS